jgi:tRNA uridine 5-carboxymethylaminomethyl modification enzyme
MNNWDDRYDVVVVGGGHAGCEAALAAARMGARSVLLTQNLDLIAQMSCNPAIGGIAKGHLVREIDALGGCMGTVADRTGIQFRLLNRSRGPAVQSPRCQSDKGRYRTVMRTILEGEPNLALCQAEVTSLAVRENAVRGVELKDGRRLAGRTVVLTTGTFLNGLIHIGKASYAAGRNGEPASVPLGEWLRGAGLQIGRLKTGTPPRVDGRTVDWGELDEQKGDAVPEFFSFRTRGIALPQISCYSGYTNERVHQLVRENLSESALYGGMIAGIGPRYCPSLEDKVVKFADRDRHQVFLEPEGLETHEVYVNGVSNSLPADVQREMVRAIPGLGRTRIIRPGYAIEYDFVQPTELTASLEVKRISGLFHAGQINGTTGYEEAAAQGLVAGINAALKAGGGDPVVLPRQESYIGTLLDDLATKGIDEPYRMFTSRSEFRLLLRIDNADRRLTPLGRRLGLIGSDDYEAFVQKYQQAERLRRFLGGHRWDPGEQIDSPAGAKLDASVKGSTLEQLLRRPELVLEDFEPLLRGHALWFDEPVRRAAAIEVKYDGYIEQQRRDVEKLERLSSRRIPEGFEYAGIDGLSREIREKLTRVRPRDLAMASRIPGVTPAAVSILHVQLELRRKQGGR